MTVSGTHKAWTKAAGVAALAIALAAPAAHAQWQGGQGGPGHGRPLFRALASLDLTQDQRDRIRGIFESAKPRFQELRAGLQADRSALDVAAGSKPVDTAAVGAAYLKVKSDRDTMKAERQKVKDQVSAVLTAEQRGKLEGYLEGMRGHRGMWGGPRNQ